MEEDIKITFQKGNIILDKNLKLNKEKLILVVDNKEIKISYIN